MVQRGECARFLLESESAVGIVGEGVGQHLDSDGALELRVVRAVALAHPAGTEEALDPERAELTAGCQAFSVVRQRECRRLAKRSRLVVRGEQRVDLRAERGIIEAGLIEIRRPGAFVQTDCPGEYPADFGPPIGSDIDPPWRWATPARL